MSTRRTSNQTLLEEVLAVKSWPIFLYDIQIIDTGSGVSSIANQFTCTDKSYDANEWQTVVGINDSRLTDEVGNTFTIGAHASGSTLAGLSGTPRDGDFDLSRWLYLSSVPEQYTGTYSRITYNSKDYLPYPVKHGAMEDHELGQFPQLVLTIPNPGTQIVDLYKAFERYQGLRNGLVYITTVFVDSAGTIYSDVDASIIDKFMITGSTITHTNISLDLQSTGNLIDKNIPARAYSRFTCDYVYKDHRCKYTGSIDKCNKLYSTSIIAASKCTLVSGQTFSVPTENRPLPDLTGCVIIIEAEGGGTTSATYGGEHLPTVVNESYIWKVASNTANTFTATSDSQLKNLSEYVSDTGEIVISIIDKYSCLGHTDTGRIKAAQWADYSANEDAKSFTEYGNLLVDGMFELGTPESSNSVAWRTSLSGMTIDSTGTGVLFSKTGANRGGWVNQSKPYSTGDERCPEKNQHYQFYMQYYGYTTSDSPLPAYIYVSIGFFVQGGAWTYYNWTTQTWGAVQATQRNLVYLRSSSYKTNFSDEFERNVKPDEVSQMVYTNWAGGSSPYIANSFNFTIGSSATDNVRFYCKIYRVGLFKYIPYEHAGRFQGIPLTRVFYV